MSAAQTKRGLADVPEAGVIIQLLNEVKRTPNLPAPSLAPAGTAVKAAPTPIPGPSPAKPAEVRTTPSPSPPAPAPVAKKSGVVPVGALTVSDFFALVNWKNRPEDAKPLPAVVPDQPPGHEWTVEAVMSAFFGD
jgi:hypothetical protein